MCRWDLTFDMSGGARGAKRPLERPLDVGVRRHAQKGRGMFLMIRRSCAARAAAELLLNRWALHGPKRAEDTAVTWVRPKHGMAAGAFVEEKACINRHGLAGREAALWAGEDGLECRLRLHLVGPNVRHERRAKGREAAFGTSARWSG